MDGFKRQLKESVRFKLLFWLFCAVFMVSVIGCGTAFIQAYEESQEFQDEVLLQVAALFDHEHLPVEHLWSDHPGRENDEEMRIIVQYLSEHVDSQHNPHHHHLSFPDHLSEGMHTLVVSEKKLRVNIKILENGQRIAIAQETNVRNEVAIDTAILTLIPFIFLVPLLLLLSARLIHNSFNPIVTLAQEIDSRNEQDLTPLAMHHIPIEIKSFVVAINNLLNKIKVSVESQRRFVNDAAHELRSPLTALLLQADRLANVEMSDQARDRVNTLRQGIERSQNLVNQLLTLARLESVAFAPVSPVSIMSIYRRVLEDLMPLIDAKSLDIGLLTEEDASVYINELDLYSLIKNVVDNSIKYSPVGGRIDLGIVIQQETITLQIIDYGSGIAIEEQQRVFDPFYRILGHNQIGSGLGLSIVKKIADSVNANVHLSFSDAIAKTGLCVTIIMPKRRELV